MSRLLPLVLLTACCAVAPFGALSPVASGRMQQQSSDAADRLSDADLQELLAPIALYPDPLLANVLAASCYPEELAAATGAAGNETAIDASDWEPSVKAVAKIPDALTMLTEYPDWTAAVGEAFILQSQDMMTAVQSLRARAYANGALTTTNEQLVTTQGDTIIIEPAQPQVVYVPSYSPEVVYVDRDDGDELLAGVIGFGLGVTTAAIIANNIDCNWWGGGACWGCGWGGRWRGDVDINIDNSINIKNNGNKWKPNNKKASSGIRDGRPTKLRDYQGVGAGGSKARVPKRDASAKPIAAQRPAPKPSQAKRPAGASRPAAVKRPDGKPMKRPADLQRPRGPKAKPSIPPASSRPPTAKSGGGKDKRPAAAPSGGAPKRPAARPAPKGGRPSAYGTGKGGGSKKAASRGSSSRKSAAGGSRGGKGGGKGGGKRGGKR